MATATLLAKPRWQHAAARAERAPRRAQRSGGGGPRVEHVGRGAEGDVELEQPGPAVWGAEAGPIRER